jgi:two-component system sensor histidine kinase RstB
MNEDIGFFDVKLNDKEKLQHFSIFSSRDATGQKDSFIFEHRLRNDDYKLVVKIESLTEQVITTTAFLLLNELGTYSVGERQERFNEITSHFSYPVYRLASSEIISDIRQLERLGRGESIIEWEKNFGRSLAVNVYTPWGSTSDVLALGTIPFFDPYPPRIMSSFLMLMLITVALSVMFIIKRFATRIHLLQDQVDAISPTNDIKKNIESHNDVIVQLNLKINEMAQRIQNLLNEKGEMIRGISHDLRTPIAKIHFRIETIAAHIGSEHPVLKGCKSDLNQLNQLIDELLTYEKISTTKIVNFEPLNLVNLVNELLDSTRLVKPNININFRYEQSLQFYFDGNKALINRLLENLLSNASKFAKSEINVGLSFDNSMIKLTVDDDGKGLDESLIHKLFNPFFQGDLSRSSERQGYGLGLAIVKQVAKEHSAEVTAKNNNLGGASFSVSFPINKTVLAEGSA